MGIFLWLALCIAVSLFASQKGRGAISWFFISLFLSPLLGFVFLLVSSDLKEKGKIEIERSTSIGGEFTGQGDLLEKIVAVIRNNYKLYKNDLIDEAEFMEKKEEAISGLSNISNSDNRELILMSFADLAELGAVTKGELLTVKALSSGVQLDGEVEQSPLQHSFKNNLCRYCGIGAYDPDRHNGCFRQVSKIIKKPWKELSNEEMRENIKSHFFKEGICTKCGVDESVPLRFEACIPKQDN